MHRPFALLVSAAMLLGCAATPPPAPLQPYFAPVLSNATGQAASADIAARVCSVDSLRAQRNETLYQARTLDVSSASGGGVADLRQSDRDGVVRIDQPPFGPQTETAGLVRAFETDLDAAYQFATAACQTYAMCMSQRDFDEYACRNTQLQWDTAQARFMQTSLQLGALRAQLAGARPAGPDTRPRRPQDNHGGGADRPSRPGGRDDCADGHSLCGGPRPEERDCLGVVADLFTSSRC